MSKYVFPKKSLDAFSCPHCGAYAQQMWNPWTDSARLGPLSGDAAEISVSQCMYCSNIGIWINDRMCYPDTGCGLVPAAGMPGEVLSLYHEAAAVAGKSPRSAAALLRLAVQHLCRDLGAVGYTMDEDIQHLVIRGLPEKIERLFSKVKVTGNGAVFPGQIADDDRETVEILFSLVNLMVEYMIHGPGEVDRIYRQLR
ncbi:DUF4145 domain-containing protein [Breznakiella homolactica]|uniref:DUF4145 domain-containing protein n=1 Tax=Breznakiella homolactica TaxID=2798577 RepID=A0A7T7XM38_9SPIR|nr:DUF4145 domain-containing protein [Breznakiella homolactica]QQO08895.1 DUF4145 domain-containing protein [Breznakiella homolactica]